MNPAQHNVSVVEVSQAKMILPTPITVVGTTRAKNTPCFDTELLDTVFETEKCNGMTINKEISCYKIFSQVKVLFYIFLVPYIVWHSINQNSIWKFTSLNKLMVGSYILTPGSCIQRAMMQGTTTS